MGIQSHWLLGPFKSDCATEESVTSSGSTWNSYDLDVESVALVDDLEVGF